MNAAAALMTLTKEDLVDLVLALRAELAKQIKKNAEQEARIAEQAAKIEQLTAAVAQLQRSSSNSSNPHSSDKLRVSKPKPEHRQKIDRPLAKKLLRRIK